MAWNLSLKHFGVEGVNTDEDVTGIQLLAVEPLDAFELLDAESNQWQPVYSQQIIARAALESGHFRLKTETLPAKVPYLDFVIKHTAHSEEPLRMNIVTHEDELSVKLVRSEFSASASAQEFSSSLNSFIGLADPSSSGLSETSLPVFKMPSYLVTTSPVEVASLTPAALSLNPTFTSISKLIFYPPTLELPPTFLLPNAEHADSKPDSINLDDPAGSDLNIADDALRLFQPILSIPEPPVQFAGASPEEGISNSGNAIPYVYSLPIMEIPAPWSDDPTANVVIRIMSQDDVGMTNVTPDTLKLFQPTLSVPEPQLIQINDAGEIATGDASDVVPYNFPLPIFEIPQWPEDPTADAVITMLSPEHADVINVTPDALVLFEPHLSVPEPQYILINDLGEIDAGGANDLVPYTYPVPSFEIPQWQEDPTADVVITILSQEQTGVINISPDAFTFFQPMLSVPEPQLVRINDTGEISAGDAVSFSPYTYPVPIFEIPQWPEDPTADAVIYLISQDQESEISIAPDQLKMFMPTFSIPMPPVFFINEAGEIDASNAENIAPYNYLLPVYELPQWPDDPTADVVIYELTQDQSGIGETSPDNLQIVTPNLSAPMPPVIPADVSTSENSAGSNTIKNDTPPNEEVTYFSNDDPADNAPLVISSQSHSFLQMLPNFSIDPQLPEGSFTQQLSADALQAIFTVNGEMTDGMMQLAWSPMQQSLLDPSLSGDGGIMHVQSTFDFYTPLGLDGQQCQLSVTEMFDVPLDPSTLITANDLVLSSAHYLSVDLVGKEQKFDLNLLNPDTLGKIDRINLGEGEQTANQLTLSVEDVLHLGSTEHIEGLDSHPHLIVTGDASDSVTLNSNADSAWIKTGALNGAYNHHYDVYHGTCAQGEANVLIQSDDALPVIIS